MGEVIYLYRLQQQNYSHEVAMDMINEWNTVVLPELRMKRAMLLKILEEDNYNNHQALMNYIAVVKEIYILSNAIHALKSTQRITKKAMQ